MKQHRAAPTTQSPDHTLCRGGSRAFRLRFSDDSNASFDSEVEWKLGEFTRASRIVAVLPFKPRTSARAASASASMSLAV